MRHCCSIDSPIGALYAVFDDEALYELDWDAPKMAYPAADYPALRQYLKRFFAGERPLLNIRLLPQGTALQEQCWRLLQSVPYGQTRSYAWLAQQMERPRAVRAVGGMVGRNPISILIPCHRIIGSNGTLTGYAGGLERKRFLLALEEALPQNQ